MRRSRYAVAFATIALFPLTVSAAQAGTYTVYTCNAPSGKAVGTSGWSRATESTDPLMQVTMACAAGGPKVWGDDGRRSRPRCRTRAPVGCYAEHHHRRREARA